MSQVITDRRGQLLLFVPIALGMFLDGLDGTIVTVALPKMAESFHMTSSGASWIVTVYFLVMAGLILVFGKICDKGAIKKVLISGFLIFSIGSLACGLSDSMALLLASRVVQGVGAAMLAASSIMLSVKFLPQEMRGFGLALGVLGSSIGAALGPALGGVLSEYFSWHWIFFINVPVGIVAAAISIRAVPADIEFDRSSFDYKGSVLLFLSLVFGLFALESTPSHGINTTTIISIVAFLVLFSVFIVYERRIHNPVLNLRLFRSRRLDMVIISFMLINACYMGSLYLLPFFLNKEMGFDTMMSGMYLLVPAVVTLAFCLWIGRLADRRGNRPFVILGCVFLLIFSAMFVFIDSEYPIYMLLIGLGTLGMVWGLCGGPLGSRLIENVPEGEKGSGSSLLSFFIYFGSALGTALFSGLFGLGSGSSGTAISDLSRELFIDGFQFTMLVSTVLAALALFLSWIVNERKAAFAGGRT